MGKGGARRESLFGGVGRAARAHERHLREPRPPACQADGLRGELRPRRGGGLLRHGASAVVAQGQRDRAGQRELPPLRRPARACRGGGVRAAVPARLLARPEPHRAHLGDAEEAAAKEAPHGEA